MKEYVTKHVKDFQPWASLGEYRCSQRASGVARTFLTYQVATRRVVRVFEEILRFRIVAGLFLQHENFSRATLHRLASPYLTKLYATRFSTSSFKGYPDNMGTKGADVISSRMQNRSWSKGDYVIYTDPSKIPIRTLNTAFASDDIYWAKPLPEDVMQETLQNSLSFGVFHNRHSSSQSADRVAGAEFVGFARCITDFTTFLYLTDVYIWPSHQGCGLGKWLVSCVQEVVEEMPHLRRSLCFTGDWKRSVPFYEKLMGMEVIECRRGADGRSGEGLAVLMRKGDGDPSKVPKST